MAFPRNDVRLQSEEFDELSPLRRLWESGNLGEFSKVAERPMFPQPGSSANRNCSEVRTQRKIEEAVPRSAVDQDLPALRPGKAASLPSSSEFDVVPDEIVLMEEIFLEDLFKYVLLRCHCHLRLQNSKRSNLFGIKTVPGYFYRRWRLPATEEARSPSCAKTRPF